MSASGNGRPKLLPVMGDAVRKRRHGTPDAALARAGMSMRPTSRSGAVGATCIGRSTATQEPHRHDAERDPWHECSPRVLPAQRGQSSGFVPDRVTTDGHNSYPRAIRSTLGRNVRHRTSVYLNNRLEQDHRGIKRGRIRCVRGFKEHDAADRFCREHDELRNFLRSRSRHNQYVPAAHRRRRFLRHARIAIGIMQIA